MGGSQKKQKWANGHFNEDENDESGKQKHLQLAESKRIHYEVEGWFDISRFLGHL